MNITRLITIGILILSISSCIPSIHGIVNDENRMTDDRILGTWTYEDGITQAALPVFFEQTLPGNSRQELAYTFERALNIITGKQDAKSKTSWEGVTRSSIPEDSGEVITIEELPYYILTHREIIEGKLVVSQHKVEMTKINQHVLLDFMPMPSQGIFDGRFATSYVLAHTFAKIQFEDGDLLIQPVDAEHIEKLLSQKRIRLKHERRNDEEIILTASTTELREFLDNYSDDPGLFESSDRLHPVQ